MANTIKKAREWAQNNTPGSVKGMADWVVENAFIIGARSEREELTRWRDPKVELPEDKIRVLVKADVGVVCAIHMGHGEFILDTGVVGYIDADEDECNVIGWRPIWEE